MSAARTGSGNDPMTAKRTLGRASANSVTACTLFPRRIRPGTFAAQTTSLSTAIS